MNIVTIIILLSLLDEIPILPMHTRANRRFNRTKAIVHNAKVYHDIIGYGIWFEEADETGKFRRWASGQEHTTNQTGRWETNYLKTRSFIDTGRAHSGDKKRKGRRAYNGEHVDKLRFHQLLADYEEYGE